MHDCVFGELTERSGSSRDSFDVRVPKVVRVSALYLSTVAVTSSTNPSKYTPLGCEDSAQQGLSTAIAMFPREREHVLTLQLDDMNALQRAWRRGCDCMLMHDVIGLLDVT